MELMMLVSSGGERWQVNGFVYNRGEEAVDAEGKVEG